MEINYEVTYDGAVYMGQHKEDNGDMTFVSWYGHPVHTVGCNDVVAVWRVKC